MAVRVKTVLTDPRNDVLGVAGGDVRCGPSLNVDEAGGGSCIAGMYKIPSMRIGFGESGKDFSMDIIRKN